MDGRRIHLIYKKMEHIKITKVENVQLYKNPVSESIFTNVTIYITATHLIFMEKNGTETWATDCSHPISRALMKVLHSHLDVIEKLPLDTRGSPLRFRCKNFRTLLLLISYDGDCYALYETLMRLSKPINIEDLYAFHYNPKSTDLAESKEQDQDEAYKNLFTHEQMKWSGGECPYLSLRLDGWTLFDLTAEYHRMGLPSDKWVGTYLNQNYQLCDTYPDTLYVPAHTRPQTLVATSKFRSKGRFPVLTFLDKNGVSITRSSQPLSGFSARCLEDEEMLDDILATSTKPFMYIVDTRPKINALANRAKGAGYENENFYSNIKFLFSPIENIHVIRNSLYKLIDACQSKHETMSAFLYATQSSGWLKHIRAILTAANLVAQAVSEQGVNVLVHCSDGWDRTAQTCSLASLLIDPYYRTIHGYLALIEKDWLAFGHKFTDRCGHLKIDRKEVSPVFLQFLDCTWQLAQQFSSQFQFNQTFLNTLIDHVYSCQYGTFIGNCQKDRKDLKLSLRTQSLWTHMFANLSSYTNPAYKRSEDLQLSYLKPNLCSQNLKVWLAAYARFDSHMQPKVQLSEIVSSTKYRLASLQDHLKFLEKKFADLTGTNNTPFEVSPTTTIDTIIPATHEIDGEYPKDQNFLPSTEKIGDLIVNFEAIPLPISDLPESYHPLALDLPNNSTPSYMNAKPNLTKANNHIHNSSTAHIVGAPRNASQFGSLDILTVDSGYDEVNHCTSFVTSHHSSHASSTEKSQKSHVASSTLPTYSKVSRPLPRLKLTAQDVEFVAIRWQTTVLSSQCSLCSTTFEDISFQRSNCWRCGRVICSKCLSRTTLPGHLCLKNAPTCLPCYKLVNRRGKH